MVRQNLFFSLLCYVWYLMLAVDREKSKCFGHANQEILKHSLAFVL